MWGNPYRVDRERTAEQAVEQFRQKIEADAWLQSFARLKLRGRDLACWCPLDQPCHADVWLDVANREESKE